MPRRANYRRFRLPAAHRRSPSDIRTSNLVMAVTFVALLGMFCLMLIDSLITPAEGTAISPPIGQTS